MRPVLIAHDEPDHFRDLLAARFPDVEFVYATTPQGVVEALARHDPEVAFSIKHPGFPDSAHVPIPAHPSVRWIQIGGSGFDHLLPLGHRAGDRDQRRRGARPVSRRERHRGDARARVRVPELRRAATRAPVETDAVHALAGAVRCWWSVSAR